MITASVDSLCSNAAMRVERQCDRIDRTPTKIVKTFLFCAVVVCLLLVPFSGVAGQTNGIAIIGRSRTSTPYACTGAGINLAISDAATPNSNPRNITAGIVDARNCTSISGTDLTTEIDVGNASSAPVTLLLPSYGTWTSSFGSTVGVPMVLKVYNKSSAISTNSGAGIPFQIVAAGNTSNGGVQYVCGNDSNALYVRMDGFACAAGAGATVTQAVCGFGGGQDSAYFGHISCTVSPSVTQAAGGLLVHGLCCGATVEMIATGCQNIANSCVPCTFGAATVDTMTSAHIRDITCNGPTGGNPNIQRQMNGDGGNVFENIYMERGSTQDLATPFVSIVAPGTTTGADNWIGVTASQDVTGSIRPMFNISSGAHANIIGARTSGVSTAFVSDANSGTTISVPASTKATRSYTTEGALPPVTFANLGTTPANGTFLYCSDCTIANPCAGSGTGALAKRLNGVWVCN